MTVRNVLRYPHPSLKKPARPCPEVDEEIRRVARDLVDTMKSYPRCVGLAAPQIGVGLRIIVVDVGGHPKAGDSSQGLLVLVNPVIIGFGGLEVAREGCLSLPEITVDVGRATGVQIEAFAPDGDARRLQSEGFEARALQHEIDHLDGILILDRAASPSEIFARRSAPSP